MSCMLARTADNDNSILARQSFLISQVWLYDCRFPFFRKLGTAGHTVHTIIELKQTGHFRSTSLALWMQITLSDKRAAPTCQLGWSLQWQVMWHSDRHSLVLVLASICIASVFPSKTSSYEHHPFFVFQKVTELWNLTCLQYYYVCLTDVRLHWYEMLFFSGNLTETKKWKWNSSCFWYMAHSYK